VLLGPLAGNDFWSGFGGGCEADNDGDTIIRFDAAAQVWVAGQFDLGSGGNGPYAECVAVSTTSDATGSYNRYRFAFSEFPDYPKIGVWPDAYYYSFNNNGSSAQVCATDRSAMIAGNTATQVCFTPSGQFGMLPADLDGATPPATGTPNFFMELDPSGASNLDMWEFSVNFVDPSDSTFTGPTPIPVASFTPTCPSATRGQCAPQPTAGSDKLETLSDRLMYRLVYRNFGSYTVLLTTHTVVGSSSNAGIRWYEIHNPESGSPTVYQSGTWSPDSQWRFMGALAMDQNADIAVGYTVSGSGSGQYPSIAYAGRVPTDTLGTLESEVVMLAGTGSQKSGGYDRWGDYSSMTVDPTDDCTFWFTESYIQTTGQNEGFNWSTGIGSFVFPGCGSGGTPNFYLSANPNSLSIAQGSTGSSTITVNPINGFTGSVTLSAQNVPSGVTATFATNPTTSTSSLTFNVSSTAATGTSTVTIQGTSGSLTNSTTINLTVTAQQSPSFTLTANPGSVGVNQGSTGSTTITVVPANGFTGSVSLSTSALPSGVTAMFNPNPTTSTSTLTFTASATATTGTTSVTVSGTSGSLSATTNVSLTVSPSGTGGTLTVSPTSEVWGKIVVGQTGGAKTVTVTNSGSSSVTISSIVATAPFTLVSAGTKQCGATLAAGKTCQQKVEFQPTSGGVFNGTLTFADSASNNPQTVTLQGTGVSLVVNPTVLNFATVTVGSTSGPLNVTITNESSSTVNFTGAGITLIGSDKKDYVITNNTCGSSLAGGAPPCTVTLEFAPLTTGILDATLQINSNGGGSPQAVTLEGTGGAN